MVTHIEHRALGPIPSIIYALIDPTTGDIRYVGKTTENLESRWASHINGANRAKAYNLHKNNWIRQCMSNGDHPLIEQLDCGVWDLDTINYRERYWISQLSAKYKLTNKTLGGDGSAGLKVSDESRQKTSERMKRQWTDSSYRESRNKAHREYWDDNTEAKEALSKRNKAIWADPNSKSRRTLASDEYKAIRSKISKEIASRPDMDKKFAIGGTTTMGQRRSCNDCGYKGAPPHVGLHLKRAGHSGYTDLAGVE